MIDTGVLDNCAIKFMVTSPYEDDLNFAASVDWQSITMPINVIKVLSTCNNKASINDVKCVIEMVDSIADVNAVSMYVNSDNDPVLCIRIANKESISDTYDKLLDTLPEYILNNDLVIIIS